MEIHRIRLESFSMAIASHEIVLKAPAHGASELKLQYD